MGPLDMKPCAVCEKPSDLFCQRCCEHYCSPECQWQDWATHKFVCTSMPALVSARSLPRAIGGKPVAKRDIEQVTKALEPLSIAGAKASSAHELVCAMWREPMIPTKDEFCEYRVNFVSQDGDIWVSPLGSTPALAQLTTDLENAIQGKAPCKFKDVFLGSLVIIGAAGKEPMRGEVVTLDKEADRAEVRLLDFGRVVSCASSQMYAPIVEHDIAKMKAFSFRIKLPINADVDLNKPLNLRMTGERTENGALIAKLKTKLTVPLSLPVQLMATKPEAKVVKILEQQPKAVFLLQTQCLNNINAELDALMTPVESRIQFPNLERMRNLFVAAQTKDGFRRAVVYDYIETPKLTFLIYEMDEGRVSLTDEVYRVPNEVLSHPARVFAATQIEEESPSKEQIQDQQQLVIKLGTDYSSSKEKVRSAYALLFENNQGICKVRLNTFLGKVADLGLKFWRNQIENGDKVYICHVAGYAEIFVNFIKAKQYFKIFEILANKSSPIEKDASLKTGDVVLVACPKLGCFRAEIINGTKTSFNVRNIDKGSTHEVATNALRQACAFTLNIPVGLHCCKLKTLCDLPAAAVPPQNEALDMLLQLRDQQQELQITFTDSGRQQADLLVLGEDYYLVGRLLPLLFKPSAAQEALQESTKPSVVIGDSNESLPSLPPETSPANSVKSIRKAKLPPPAENLRLLKTAPPTNEVPNVQRFFYEDVDKELLPLGKEVSIMFLESGNVLQTGCMVGVAFPNEKAAIRFQQFLSIVAEHEPPNVSGYKPEAGELCVAIYSDDEQWYRAICKKYVSDKEVHIFYLDFGNSEVVPMERIRPISPEFIKEFHATPCYLKDFEKMKNLKPLVEKLAKNNIFVCSVEEGPDRSSRYVSIPGLSLF